MWNIRTWLYLLTCRVCRDYDLQWETKFPVKVHQIIARALMSFQTVLCGILISYSHLRFAPSFNSPWQEGKSSVGIPKWHLSLMVPVHQFTSWFFSCFRLKSVKIVILGSCRCSAQNWHSVNLHTVSCLATNFLHDFWQVSWPLLVAQTHLENEGKVKCSNKG